MTRDKEVALVVGLQFLLEEMIVAVWKLEEVFKLGTITITDIKVQCLQVSGHLSNDNNQVNILIGQPS